MNKVFKRSALATRIWLLTSVFLGAIVLVAELATDDTNLFILAFPLTVAAAICSLPVLALLMVVIPIIERLRTTKQKKILLLTGFCFLTTLSYSLILLVFGLFTTSKADLTLLAEIFAALFGSSLLALLFSRGTLSSFFTTFQPKQTYTMETSNPGYAAPENNSTSQSNKILFKGLVTGGLILLMLIPTVFIDGLVKEREARQKQISKEVSSKWANAQTLSGPYLYLPYKTYSTNKDGKAEEALNALWILPENLSVEGKVVPEVRKRSIYEVLLYKTALQDKGNFEFHLPKDVEPANIQFADARICFNISDFKGIERKFAVNFNGVNYELSPGLPGARANDTGLSAPVALTADDFGKKLAFSADLELKGSGQLHFVPLSGNSEFALQSTWANPSFDGNNLPAERNVTGAGFYSRWIFNKANLPFDTVLKEYKVDEAAIAFGVTMLEPADQYAKTERCVKYAILFIGLTFGLFFIVELMQHKPVHPVQYVLIGLALVIFYTLLLSVSEFIEFDPAYFIAALATISLITLYAYNHFRKFSSAAIFGGVLTTLYGFIFILISLEDAALLVGSIGLFIVLALVMFSSRKINWYGDPGQPSIAS